MLFQRPPWKSLLGNCVMVEDVAMLHIVQGMTFKGFTQNFMPNTIYLVKASHHRRVHRQFWQDMLNHECILQRREQTFRVFSWFFMAMGRFWGFKVWSMRDNFWSLWRFQKVFGFWRQDKMFCLQSWRFIASRVLSTTHQLGFGKNHNLGDTI